MSKVLDKCPNCEDPNLAGYQGTQKCNVCGWDSTRADVMPPKPEEQQAAAQKAAQDAADRAAKAKAKAEAETVDETR